MPYTLSQIDWAKEGYDLNILMAYTGKGINMSYYSSFPFITPETFEQRITRLLKEYGLSK